MDRTQAQARVKQVQFFQAELRQAIEDGALELTPGQTAALTAYHRDLLATLARQFDVDANREQGQLSLGMKIVSALGGLALCVALSLLVQRYWGRLETPVQVALLLAVPLGAIALIEFSSRRERNTYFTGLFALVAIAAFVISTFEMGRLFSLHPSPATITVWGLFCGLAGSHYGLRLPFLAGLALVAISIPLWFHYLTGWTWFNPFARAELTAAVALAGLAWKGRPPFEGVRRGWFCAYLLSALITLSEWGESSYLPLGPVVIESAYTILVFVVAATFITLAIRRGWPETMVLGSVSFGGFLLLKAYRWLWDIIPPFLFFAFLGALALGLLWIFQRLRARMKRNATPPAPGAAA